jgi:hypothetical protein
MIKKIALAILAVLLLSSPEPLAAPSPALDLQGVLYSVDMVTTVSGGLASGRIIRMTATSPDGTRTEEFLPVDTDSARERTARIYFDPGTDQLVVGWVTLDGSVSLSSRQAPGLWLSPVILETGTEGVASFHAGIDRLSRIQVVWETERGARGTTALRHRTYDVITLNPISEITNPFQPKDDPVGNIQPVLSGHPEGGTDDPGYLGGGSSSAASVDPDDPPASDEPDTRGPAVRTSEESYGVVAGCSVPVAYRDVRGSQVEVSTLSDDVWSRGHVSLEAERGSRTSRELASEIATRFCWP